jgi:hypothetical protein
MNKDYLEGKLGGMFECYDIAEKAMSKVIKSLEDVWSIHEMDDNFKNRANNDAYMAKLEFANNSIRMLRQVFQDDYDSKIDEAKALVEMDDLGEMLLQHIDDLEKDEE